MRLVGYFLEDYKGLTGYLPLSSPVTVLFGANNSGKTNLLEALRAVAGWPDPDSIRTDPTEQGDPQVDGSLLVELENADVPGHPDHRLLVELLTFQHVEEMMYLGFLDEDAYEELATLPLGDVKAWLEDAMVEHGSNGDPSDRRLLAQHLLAGNLFMFGWEDTYLAAHPTALAPEAMEAAVRLSSLVDADDHLLTIATTLAEGGVAWVQPVASSFQLIDAKTRSRLVPEIRFLDSDPASLREDIVSHVRQVVGMYRDDDFGVQEIFARHDRWIEELQEPASSGSMWQRVAADVHRACGELVDAAISAAPSFLLELGEPSIAVLPPSAWLTAGHRIEIRLDDGGHERDIGVLGEGVQRWIACCFRIAMVRHLRQERIARRDRGAEEEGPTQLSPEMIVIPEQLPVWLIDEPEAHLHLGAVRSVADWLVRLGLESTAVVVATHHPLLLELGTSNASFVHVERSAGATSIRGLPSLSVDALDELSRDVGLRRADVLALTRLAVFVEGPHDQAVLDAVFGDDFRAAGIRIFPFHGLDNAMALIDGELVRELGFDVAVVADNTNHQRVLDGNPRGYEESVLARLIYEMRRAGGDPFVIGLAKRDVVEYLDDECCRAEAPGFPGWEQAVREWNADGRPQRFKGFVEQTYGLQLDRDAVSRLAVATALSGRVDPELRSAGRRLLARAASGKREVQR